MSPPLRLAHSARRLLALFARELAVFVLLAQVAGLPLWLAAAAAAASVVLDLVAPMPDAHASAPGHDTDGRAARPRDGP